MSATNERTKTQYGIRAVQRVCDIIDLLQRQSLGVSLAEVAKVADMPKSTAFRYMATLEERGFVERIPEDQRYRMSVGLMPPDSRELENFVQLVLPRLASLRDAWGETVNLGILRGDDVVYLAVVEAARAVRMAVKTGDRDFVHSTALGKAMASQLDEGRVRKIAERSGLPAVTERTTVDVDALVRQLAQVRRQGYALDDRENEADARCIAVTVPQSPVLAAISVSAPSARLSLSDVPRVAGSLQEVAEQIAADYASGRQAG